VRPGFIDWGVSEYGGAAPPPGDPPHRFQITVYALDLVRCEGGGPTTTYAMFNFMIRQHVLAKGTLTGQRLLCLSVVLARHLRRPIPAPG
jgi:phosphatidylethanolamine-binding protein (PEBP) family uncharacterized protein